VIELAQIKMEDLSPERINEIIDICDQMLEKSYCVYSRFAVASVLMTECGKVFTGESIASSIQVQLSRITYTL
jgi:cytidine deaminase